MLNTIRTLFISWLLSQAVLPTAADEIRFSVTEPSGVARTAWPITSGVPVARGVLSDPTKTALFGPDGKQLALQTEVLSRWTDGSVEA